ncbi:2,3-diaminopropionate biosynthesis protein SbnB [Streptomyces sp. NPDC020330]|uniref:2,3-diaminopropionate biosynthesis protein SbnB n=1 Tax=unclassified Streptomyces TaxID=2593676 RepID=UPI0037954DDB
MGDGVLVLGREQVAACLADRHQEIVTAVRSAYEAHAAGTATVPFSVFLTDSSRPRDRIVGMPAYLRADERAGMKWISSFPGNVDAGKDRASSVIAVNSLADGRVTSLMEGSEVNFARTGASAALAARTLHTEERLSTLGVIGCGPINLAIVRNLLAEYGGECRILLFDVVEDRARLFATRVRAFAPGAEVGTAGSTDEVLGAAPLVSIATNVREPHIASLTGCPDGATILHMSVRDIAPGELERRDNVVDDPDHICRVGTSLHRLEQRRGHRDFIRCTLGDVLLGRSAPRRDRDEVLVYSQFGLAMLDIAVAAHVQETAEKAGIGTRVPDFHGG